jgi:hypothetical protein
VQSALLDRLLRPRLQVMNRLASNAMASAFWSFLMSYSAGVGRSTLSVACCAWRPARTAAGSRRVVHASQRVRADHLPQPIEVDRQLEPGDQLSPELRRQVLVGAAADAIRAHSVSLRESIGSATVQTSRKSLHSGGFSPVASDSRPRGCHRVPFLTRPRRPRTIETPWNGWTSLVSSLAPQESRRSCCRRTRSRRRRARRSLDDILQSRDHHTRSPRRACA